MDRHSFGRLLWGGSALFVIAWSLASLAQVSDAPAAADATTPSQGIAPLPELTSSAEGEVSALARGLPIISSRTVWTHDFFFPNEQSPQFRVALGVAAGRESVRLYGALVPNDVAVTRDYCCPACALPPPPTAPTAPLACNTGCTCNPNNGSDDVLLAVWTVSAVSDALGPNNLAAKRRFGSFDHADQPTSTGYELVAGTNRFKIDVNTVSDGQSNSGFKIDGRWVCRGLQGNAWLYFDLGAFNNNNSNGTADDLKVVKVEGGCGEINETASVDFVSSNEQIVAFAGHTIFGNVAEGELSTAYDSEGSIIASFDRDESPADSTFIITRDDRRRSDRLRQKLLPSAGGSKPAGLALDGSGNVFIVGTFSQDIDLGNGVVDSTGGEDIYLAQYSPRGNFMMARTFGTSGDDSAGWPCAVSVDEDQPCTRAVAPALSIDPNDGSIIVRGDVADGLSVNNTPVGSTFFQLRLPPGSNRLRCANEPCLTNLGRFQSGCFSVPQTGPQCTLPDGDSGACFLGTCQPIPANPPVIIILSATYGGNCNTEEGNDTISLSDACTGLLNCSYIIDYQLIGDPAPFCEKDYVVQYVCGSDPTVHSVSMPPEAGLGSVLELDCGN